MNTPTFLLIIEDDETHIALIKRTFEKQQSDIIIKHATSLKDARDIIASSIIEGAPPNLILSDLLLPDGKGTEIIPHGETYIPYPLIVMTSHGDEQAAVEAIKAGALDYIVKSDATLTDMPHIISRALREWDHINERLKAEDNIRESEENLSVTLDSIGEAVIVTDTKATITRANPMAEKLIGIPSSQMLGNDILSEFILVNAHSRKPIDNPVETVLRRGKMVRFAYHTLLIGKENQEHRVAISGAPIKNKQDKIIGIVLVFRDITEQSNLENQLRHAQKMKAIGQLAGGIAHDFNNLLTGIVNFTELLKQRATRDERSQKFCEGILKATKRASDLTSKLLTFARKGSMQMESADIHTIINDVVSILQHTLDPKIRLKQFYHAKIAHIIGSSSQIQNALLNIALNARDAMQTGGTLSFQTQNTTLSEQFCSSVTFDIQPGEYVEITITDTGVGMDEQTKSRLFEPFFTTKEVGKGTGLGLATVYGTIKNHHGAITVDSTVDKGTTFSIFLPIATDIKSYSPSDVMREPILGTGHILLVDDEETIRELGEEILGQLGYTTTVCENGRTALDYYTDNADNVDLVLLDLIMPELDGLELLRILKKIKPDVKAIITTGYSDKISSADLHESGALQIIQKPYNLIDISHALNSALQ